MVIQDLLSQGSTVRFPGKPPFLANVVAEYMLPLCTGAVDPDEKLPEFLQKLDDAGINDILDDANAQLDEFMAAKGN